MTSSKDMELHLLRLSARYPKQPTKRKAISAEYRSLHARWMQSKSTLFSEKETA